MADRADLVVIGAGTIGGWASVFAAEDGVGRVVVLERGLAGMGASSRAAGVVRAQGGTPETVALGRWSIDFYERQAATYGTDSGFRELGYLILAVTEDDERAGHERVAMQQGAGLTDVRWLTADEAAALVGTLAPAGHRGGSYRDGDGHIDPPRNVRAYSLAMQAAHVELRERTAGIRPRCALQSGQRAVRIQRPAARGRLDADRDRSRCDQRRHRARVVHQLRDRPDLRRRLRLKAPGAAFPARFMPRFRRPALSGTK